MRSKQLNERGAERTFAIIFDTDDEVIAGMQEFAEQRGLFGSHFTAIGAFSSAVLAYFDWESREYQRIPVQEQVEVLSLIGDIADSDGKPKIHAHVVVGKRDGTAHGGHLLEARVRPTLEVIVTESPMHLRRKMNQQAGLPLIVI